MWAGGGVRNRIGATAKITSPQAVPNAWVSVLVVGAIPDRGPGAALVETPAQQEIHGLPASGRVFQLSEPEVNSMLRDWHEYEDYALLRRELCDLDMMRRTPNGRVYRRVEHDMPAEARLLAERFASPQARA